MLEARDRIGGRIWTAPFGPGAIDLGAAWVHGPVGNPVAELLTEAGIETRNDGAFFSRMAVWSDGWVDAPGATAMTAAAMADWDLAEALAGLAGSDRFADGVEWFLADRELEGRAADLARFGLLWVDGALVVAGHPDRISLAGTAAYEEGPGGNLVVTGGYRVLVEHLAQGSTYGSKRPSPASSTAVPGWRFTPTARGSRPIVWWSPSRSACCARNPSPSTHR